MTKPEGKQIMVSIKPNVALQKLKLVKRLGCEITELRMNYFVDGETRRYEKVLEDAVIKYCRTTLTKMVLDHCYQYSMNDIEEPFPNVQSVTFYKGHLGSTLSQLHKWFPALKSLVFHDVSISNSKCIQEEFEFLDTLVVGNPRRERNSTTNFTNVNLRVCATLNPKLKNLHIRHDNVDESETGRNAIIIDYDLMSFISKNLQLDLLILNLENYNGSEKVWRSVIDFETLATLHIKFSESCFLGKIRLTCQNLHLHDVKF